MSSKRKNTPTKWSTEDIETISQNGYHGNDRLRNESENETGSSLFENDDDDVTTDTVVLSDFRGQEYRRGHCSTPEEAVSSTVAKANDAPSRGQTEAKLGLITASWLEGKGVAVTERKDDDDDDEDIMDSLRAMISSAQSLDDKQRTLNDIIRQLKAIKDSLMDDTNTNEVRSHTFTFLLFS